MVVTSFRQITLKGHPFLTAGSKGPCAYCFPIWSGSLSEHVLKAPIAPKAPMSSEDKRPDSPPAQRNDLQGQLPAIHRQLHRLGLAAWQNDIIVHAPSQLTQQQLFTKCNKTLQAAKTAKAPVSSSALRPMQTSNTGCRLWHLELDDQDAKHALFGDSKAFRQQGIYLDDHLTQQQLDGRRRLAPQRLHLKELGYRTWWRQDVLNWIVDGAVDMQRP